MGDLDRLAAAGAGRTPGDLDKSLPRTHAFYRQPGFALTSVGHPFPGAPTLWTMTRPPGRDSTPGRRIERSP